MFVVIHVNNLFHSLTEFLKPLLIKHYDIVYLLEHTFLKRSPDLNWIGCSGRPTTLHPNHDVRQVCEKFVSLYILLCVCLAYKCLLCLCGEYVQRSGQYFYISNSNPLIIETNNFNSNLLRKCHPRLEAQTLCYQIMYLKVNLKQINCLICNNTSLTNYDIFNTFKLSIIYFRDLQLPCHEVNNHYTYFVFEMSLIITCYTAYSYIRLIYLIKRRYK